MKIVHLAGRTRKSEGPVVEEAFRDREDRMFWADVQHAFAAGPETEELRAERDLWECTVPDGLAGGDEK